MRERVLLEREKESCKSTGGGGGEGAEEQSKQGEKAGRQRGGTVCCGGRAQHSELGRFMHKYQVMKCWRLHFEHSG